MKHLLTLLCFAALALGARAADVAFIAHPDVAATSLSADDVKGILLGTKAKWDSGGALKLAVFAEGALHEQVVREHTQRSADQFDKYWKKLVFTGKGMLPTTVKTDAEMIDFVAKTPGAFGYVAKESVSSKVKVVPVH
jgi:ABC-type phosphate transport system substrate-binding protein